MKKLKEKKYLALIGIIVLFLGIIGLFSLGKVDKYKGLIKVSNTKIMGKALSSVSNISKGTDVVDYEISFTLDEVEGVTKRDVIIEGTLNNEYASFKEINSSNITSTVSDNGKEIEIEVKDVVLGEEQNITLKVLINNAPNNEEINPVVKIKERTGEYTKLNAGTIKVETNSIVGLVLDENNLPVSNIELSLNKNDKEIKRTYTNVDGKYVFSDIESGTYKVKVEEEVYEIVNSSETTENNDSNIIKVKEVDKYNIETHKYIEKLKLVVNGKEHNYSYKDSEKVIETVKNAKTISGEIEYKIVIKNKSEKDVVVDRVEDIPSEGLEFKASKNTSWREENNKIYYKPIEGSTLKGKETREVTLVLDITSTNEIKEYLNRLNVKGEIKEKVVYIVDGEIVKEESVIEGDTITKPNLGIENLDGWYTDENYTNKYKFSNEVNKDIILYARTKDETKEYTVKYINEGNIIKEEVVKEGEKVTGIDEPSKIGYTFKCFKLNESCYDFDTEVTSDIDLISSYEIIEYTINYNLNGGIVSESNPTKYTIETDTFTLNNPSKTGYTFTGWTGSNTSSPSTTVTIEKGTVGNLTFAANYSINSYTLTIDPNGGVYPSDMEINGDYGSIVSVLESSKDGYNFTGYTLTGSGTYNNSIYTFGVGNGTLKANYSPIEYTINYTGLTNEEKSSLNNPNSYTIETNTFSLNNPSNRYDADGDLSEIFVGWKDKEENVSSAVTIPSGSTGNKEYEAVFVEADPDVYTITYNLNGGIVSESNPNSYTKKTNTFSLNNPTKEGYTFTGWTGSNGDTPSTTVTIEKGTRGNLSYTANFTPIEYTINYNLDGGSVALSNPSNYTIETNSFTLNNPTKEGYTFTGWTGSNGDTPSTSVTVEKGTVGNLNYKANYNINKYTVEFYNMKSDGTYKKIDNDLEKDYNSVLNESEVPTVTLSGYTFKYWKLNDNEYNYETKITGDIKLYASYEKDVYTITYDLDGGSVTPSNPSTYSIDTEDFTLNNPSKTGYTFTGWTGSNGDAPSTSVTVEKGTVGNLSYKANYNINTFTVTFMNGENIFYKKTGVEYKSRVSAPSDVPTKTHNIFIGWVDENDNEYDFNSEVTSDITLYASYEKVEAPNISHTPTEWTKDNVKVTISSNHSDYTYMYKIGSGEYQSYTEPFEVSENAIIYAYSVKSNISSVEVTHEIDNIDKINPSINEYEIKSITPTSITLGLKLKDNESGIDYYKVYVDNEEVFTSNGYTNNLNDEKEEEYTISNLEQVTSYTIKVEVYDKVGNKYSEEKEVQTTAKHYVARTVNDEGEEINRYESLKEAIESDECISTCNIEVLDNVEETNNILDGQNIILDLNGYTITGLNDYAINNNGKLQIIDTNEDEIGKVYSEGKAIINSGILTIGNNEEELYVDASEPIIEGSINGIESTGTLNFFDGQIMGSSSSGAIKGLVTETPYSYNVSAGVSSGKEIATLEIIADAEARINSVYYLKAQEAVDDSKNGTYEEQEGSAEIMSQIKTKSDYKFVYNEEEGTLKNNNQDLSSTTANSYIYFDLTNEDNDKVISIDASISSYTGKDIGYITVTNSNDIPKYSEETGRIMYISGTMSDNVNYVLEKGKKYYVHLGYYSSEYTGADSDTFTINSITLSDYIIDSSNDLLDNLVSDSEWHFIKQNNGSYKNRNNLLNYNYNLINNTTSHSYIKVDLTNEVEDKVLYIDAEINSGTTNFGYVTVTNSSDMPTYTDEDGRQIYITNTISRKLYEVTLSAGEVNYIHFGAYRNSGFMDFTIYSVRLEDEVVKEHLNSDITTNGTYYMYETNEDPVIPDVWKDLSGNGNDARIYNASWNDSNDGLIFNGSNSYVPIKEMNTENFTWEATFNINTIKASEIMVNYEDGGTGIYIDSNKNLIGVAYIDGEYRRLILSDSLEVNRNYKVSLSFDGSIFKVYLDNELIDSYEGTTLKYPTNSTVLMLGSNPTGTSPTSGTYFDGTIYSVKVYSRALTEEEITDTSNITDDLQLYLDGANHEKKIGVNVPAFINNNQYRSYTAADSYMVFDLTDLPTKTIYVNAEISSQENGDYGYVYVNTSASTQSYNNSSGRYIYISGEVEAKEYPVTLTGGRVNYLHFAYYKNGSVDSGKDTFKINYIKYYEDSSSTVPTYIFSNSTTKKNLSPVVKLNEEVDTVELLRNITMTDPLEIEETRDVVLDLRGYTLTTNKEDYVINNKGSLTIIDSDYTNQIVTNQEKYEREQSEFDEEYDRVIEAKEASDEASDIYTIDDYISDGLQLHYDGLSPGDDSSTTWKDLSGNGNDARIYNASWNESNDGLIFNGSNSYVPIKEMNTENFTWEATFNINTIKASEIMANYETGGTGIYIDSNKNLIGEAYIDGAYRDLILSDSLEVNRNYQVSLSFDGSIFKVYLDNELIDSYEGTTLKYPTNSTVLMLGSNPSGTSPTSGTYFDGTIYNVKVYNRALKHDEITRNYNVNIIRYNLDAEIQKRVATLDSSSQNGLITSTTYNAINNGVDAYLNIKQAIVQVNKEGYYNVVDNHGNITMESDGYINALKRYNRGIYNYNVGDVLDGEGTITTYLGDSVGLYNESSKDTGFTGYNFYSTNSSSKSINNNAKTDITFNDINVSGSGYGIIQNSTSGSNLTINNSTINSTGNNSILSNVTGIYSEIILNNIKANNTIYNKADREASSRKIIINDSLLDSNNGYIAQVENGNTNFEINNTEFVSCVSTIINNTGTMTVNDSTITIPNDCKRYPSIEVGVDGFYNDGNSNFMTTINNITFNKHNSYTYDQQALIKNNCGIMTINGGSLTTDYALNYAILNKGGNTIVKGNLNIGDNFKYGIYNSSGSYSSWNSRWFSRNATLTVGEDDEKVSTEYPKIKGTTSAIYSESIIKKSSNGGYYYREEDTNTNIFNFYDGALIGEEDNALYSTVSSKPDNYDLNVNIDNSVETITLKNKNSINEEDYVAKIGNTKYVTLQKAVDAVSLDNTETEIDIIKDFITAETVETNENQNIKLNYNNHFIRSHYSGDYLTNNGKLKIYDDTNEITKISKSFSDNFIVNNNDLELNNIKISGLKPESQILKNNSEALINSGYYKSKGSIIENNLDLTINNGDFISNNLSYKYYSILNKESGVINVNGGYYYYNEDNYSLHYLEVAMINNQNILNIHDGTFILNKNNSSVVRNDTTGTVTIDGGNYDNTLKKYSENTNDKCYLLYNYGIASIENITLNYNYIIQNLNKTVDGVLTIGNVTISNLNVPKYYSEQNNHVLKNNGNLVINKSNLVGSGRILNDGSNADLKLNGVTIQNDYNRNGNAIIISGSAKTTLDKYIDENENETRTSITSSYFDYDYYGYGGTLHLENASLYIEDADIFNTNAYNSNSGIYITGSSASKIIMKSGSINVTKGIGIKVLGSGSTTVTIGEKDGNVSTTNPEISGTTYGIYSSNPNAVLNFYDGIVSGSTNQAISMTLNENETGYDIISEDRDDKEYKYNGILPAYINTTSERAFDTLQKAIDAANDGETIKVQRSILISSTSETAINTKNITLDLNGKVISQSNENFISNSGTLNIIDSKGTVDSDGVYNGTGAIVSSGGVIFKNTGTLTIDAGNFYISKGKDSCSAARTSTIKNLIENNVDTDNNKEGIVYINNGYYYTNGDGSAIVYNNSKTYVTGGIFYLDGYCYNDSGWRSKGYSMVVNNVLSTSVLEVTGGTYPNSGSPYITINNGTATISDISSSYTNLATNNAGGTLNIDNVTSEINTSSFVIANGGNVNINDSSFITNGSNSVLTANNDSNVTIDNSTLKSYSNVITMNNTSNVTIKNTDNEKITLIGGTGNSKYSDHRTIYNNSSGLLTIESGSVLGENLYSAIWLGSNSNINIGVKDVTVNNTPTITGYTYGIYCNDASSTTINFYDGVVKGQTAIEGIINETETGYNILSDITDSMEEKSVGKEKVVTNTTTNESYYKLSVAFNDASSGDTLKLIRNVTQLTEDGTITVPSEKTLTLDLNDYHINLSGSTFIENNGTLTITDSSDNKTGKIKSFISKIIINNKTFTIDSGSMICEKSVSDIITNSQNSTMTISGGTIYNYIGRLIYNEGTLNITGGEIYNKFAKSSNRIDSSHNLIDNSENGIINVSGGTFTYSGKGGIINNNNSVTITGGTLNSKGYEFENYGWNRDVSSAVINNANGTVSITGGTFTSDNNWSRIIYNQGVATIDGVSSTYYNIAYNSNDLTINSLTDENVGVGSYYFGSRIITNTGNLEINNSTFKNSKSSIGIILSSSGTAELTNSTFESSGVAIDNSGELTIHSGNYESTGSNNTLLVNSGAKTTIENGTFTSNTGNTITNTGTLDIKSASVTSSGASGIYTNGGTLNIGESGGIPSTTNPSIYGKKYGLYNNGSSNIYFYDGVIKGETGSIYGTITGTEAGYKEKSDSVTDPDTGVTTIDSTLTVVGSTERVAVVGSVNFISLQAAVNYASNNGITGITLYRSVTLDDNLVKPEGGSNVTIYLNENTITEGSYTIGDGITVKEGTDPNASLSRFLASITGTEINPRNIVIYQMEDGNKLEANVTYKLYKLVDNEYKLVKLEEEEIGYYKLGNTNDSMKTTRGKIYIDEIGEGSYKLVGSDNKELTFEITADSVSSNIRINVSTRVNRLTSTVATLILTLQTGIVRNPYVLMVMILIIFILGMIAYKKYKKESYE